MSTHSELAAPAPVAVADARVSAREAAAYANPYLAGIGLGLVLLGAFVIMGRGLGASGAINALVAWLVHAVAPSYATANGFLGDYIGDGSVHPLKTWLVFEVLGVAVGAVLSAVLARRMTLAVERGPRASIGLRLALAFVGGMTMAVGAALARGCTSGQALTGGALLNLGSWAFMLSVFAGAYGVAWLARGQWR